MIIQLDSDRLLQYDQWVTSHTHGNLWQSLSWKKFQESLGREVRIYAIMDNKHFKTTAMVIIDKTTLGLSVWDIPRGPLFHDQCTDTDKSLLLQHIHDQTKQEQCMTVYFSGLQDVPNTIQTKVSDRHEQPEASVVVNIEKDTEEILRQMKPKGRYNIRVAAKKNVHTELSTDVRSFYRLIQETSKRDGFSASSFHKYEKFMQHIEGSFLLLAFTEDSSQPIAGLIGVIRDGLGIYYYGASSYEHRALMAPYALQWDAMTYCKEQGCTSYDLLGIAPVDAPKDHPWQGITSFKQKFGGAVVMYPPEKMIVLKPLMKALIDVKRRLFR